MATFVGQRVFGITTRNPENADLRLRECDFSPPILSRIAAAESSLGRLQPQDAMRQIQKKSPTGQRREGFFYLKNRGIASILPSWKDISD